VGTDFPQPPQQYQIPELINFDPDPSSSYTK
jgi:hypothetical protein